MTSQEKWFALIYLCWAVLLLGSASFQVDRVARRAHVVAAGGFALLLAGLFFGVGLFHLILKITGLCFLAAAGWSYFRRKGTPR